MQHAAADFRFFISELRLKLSNLFDSDLPGTTKRQRKADIFNSIPGSLDTLQTEKWQGRRYYANWSEGPYNNARLALFNTYEGSHCAFQSLWNKANGDAGDFHQLAKQMSKLQDDKRAEWLNQTC